MILIHGQSIYYKHVMKLLNYLPPLNIQYVIYKTTLPSIEYLTFSPIILSKLHPRYIVFSSSVVYFTISSFRITYCIDRNICKEKLNSTVQKIVIVTMFRLSSIFLNDYRWNQIQMVNFYLSLKKLKNTTVFTITIYT